MSLRVILVDDETERAQLVKEALQADGFEVVAVFGTGADLPETVGALSPPRPRHPGGHAARHPGPPSRPIPMAADAFFDGSRFAPRSALTPAPAPVADCGDA